MLKTFFTAMDYDKDGSVSKDEAIKFWGKNFAKVYTYSTYLPATLRLFPLLGPPPKKLHSSHRGPDSFFPLR